MSIFVDAEWLLPSTPISGEESLYLWLKKHQGVFKDDSNDSPSQMHIIIIVIENGVSSVVLYGLSFFVILFFCVGGLLNNIFHYVAKLIFFFFLCSVTLKTLLLLQTLNFILYFSCEGCDSPGWGPAFLMTDEQDLSTLKTFHF